MPNVVDVLCVGMASYDLIFTVSHPIGEDEKSAASSLTKSGGGPAASAAIAVSRLGLSSAFAGYLGMDRFGDDLMQDFIDASVNTKKTIRGTESTSISAVLVTPSGKRALVNYRSPEPLAEQAIDFSDLRAKVILFDGHEPAISLPLINLAAEWGAKTVLDAGSVHEGTRQLATRIDYLVSSERFARDFTGEDEPSKALKSLQVCASSIVITVGERGLYWYHENQSGRMPAFRIHAVDTTGAGDAFHGAFSACLALDWDWESALRFSSAAAALCCTKLGGRPGLPTMQEVEDFLAEQESINIQV